MLEQGHLELGKEQLSDQSGKILHYEPQESYVEALYVFAGPVKSCDWFIMEANTRRRYSLRGPPSSTAAWNFKDIS